MALNKMILFLSGTLIAGIVFFGVPVDNNIDLRMPSWLAQEGKISTLEIQLPDWLIIQEAVASPYRRSVRRTSRRTSRRVSRRHSYARGGGYYGGSRYYGGAAVATGVAVGVAAIAVGTMVVTLPPACTTIVVNGVAYQDCSGTYYAPSGSQWIVVNAP